MSGWSSLNTMHILLVSLQKAQPEACPIIATIVLQLDLMGDPLKCSVYREEALEAITAAFDSHTERVQEQLARALMILGGQFSYKGEPSVENWLLKEARFDESLRRSFSETDNVADEYTNSAEEDLAAENWQRKTAVALLTGQSKKFLGALSDSTASGIPCLARASLATIAWISSFLHSVVDENLQSASCSILVPQLIKSLHYVKALEERVLASLSLFNLSRCSDFALKFPLLDKELMASLHDLSRVTWPARELTVICTRNSRQQFTALSKTATQSGKEILAFDNKF